MEQDAYEGIDGIEANPGLTGQIEFHPAVPYRSDKPGLVMDVAVPMRTEREGGALPAVLFVQGSGWTTPNRLYAIPRIARLVARGFVIATANHTDSEGGAHPFPAYLEDIKSALRFLRLNAADFHVDPKRIGVWGTSSGGNTALLLGMTAGDPRYDDGSNPGAADNVDYVVACFPPADIPALLERDRTEGIVDCVEWVTGGDMARARAMSPSLIVKPETDCPPTLLLHGDADELVPYAQSERLYEAMRGQGHEVSMVRVAGGEHEGTFWSDTVVDVIANFIEAHA